MKITLISKPKVRAYRDPSIAVFLDCKETHQPFYWGADPDEDFDVNEDYETKRNEGEHEKG